MEAAISTSFRVASSGRRFVGQLVDDVSVMLIALAALFGLSEAFDVGFSEALSVRQALATVAALLAALTAPALIAGLTNGRTLGKLIAGTRAVRLDGEAIDLQFALRRELWSKRVTWGYAFRGLADWNAMRSDAERRSGHDRDLGTIVVNV
jgi:uncharacterized RDD family membrane protein YckC